MGMPGVLSTKIASLTLRPPRVAVLFRGDENWRQWARLAVTSVTEMWGGESAIFVPYAVGGAVNPAVMSMVTAYDPDVVAVMRHTVRTWQAVAGGGRRRADSQLDNIVQDEDGLSAAHAVIRMTNPLTLALENAVHSGPSFLDAPDHNWRGRLTAAPHAWKGPARTVKAGSRAWSGDLALYTAALFGMLDGPDSRVEPDDEVLLRHFVDRRIGDVPSELIAVGEPPHTEDARRALPTLYEELSPGLGRIRVGHNPVAGAIVLGDSADDFALAVGYERQHGWSLWLPTPELEHALTAPGRGLTHVLQSALDLTSPGDKVFVTSATHDDAHQSRFIEAMRGRLRSDRLDEDPLIDGPAPWVNPSALYSLVMTDHIGIEAAVAVQEDIDGSFTLLNPLTPPQPHQEPGVPAAPYNEHGNPAWVVDVSFEGQPMPAGRGLLANKLHGPGDRAMAMKSSREGISYWSAYEGFVSSNTVAVSRLARPRLRVLGVQSWVADRVGIAGYRAQLSQAGRTASLVRNRLGSRDAAIRLIIGPAHGLLRLYVDKTVPRTEGLADFGRNKRYMTGAAMQAALPGLNESEARELIDPLLEAGLLWQGTLLDCTECARKSFVELAKLAQTYDCPECGFANSLSYGRWKESAFEPSWFYAMSPILSNLLEQDGDVVLKTAARLMVRGRGGRSYYDTAEIEFTRFGQDKPDFEIDLIALVDGELIVAEAKKGSLSTRRSERLEVIRKRFDAARLLRADRVIFSSLQRWSDSDRTAVTNEQRDRYPEIAFEMMELGPIDH